MFRHANSAFRFKILVSDAVIRSKLLYGLETVALNDAIKNKTNAFQLKFLRKILQIPTTFVNRLNTNEYVCDRANAILARQDAKPIKQFSVYHRERCILRLARLLILKDKDPSAAVTLEFSTLKPHDYGKWRVGRPRIKWLTNTINDMWEDAKKCLPEASRELRFDHDQPTHIKFMYEYAHILNRKHKITQATDETTSVERHESDEEFGPHGTEAPSTPPGFGPFGNDIAITPPRQMRGDWTASSQEVT